MRRPRLKAPEYFESAIYHCVSRVVDRQIVLHESEKEQFTHYMRMYEMLFGLNIITYCVMGNHFHILVEIPKRPEVLPTDEELVALVRKTKGNQEANSLASWFQLWREQGNHAAAEAERENYFRQMWDVSQFMKVLKQRFTLSDCPSLDRVNLDIPLFFANCAPMRRPRLKAPEAVCLTACLTARPSIEQCV